ncbi:MAG TPA: serine hydrolase domain-containing protein, partial [Longimicrobiales bacterium]|nr:serine hydrolase domain-containing protein [Longimicrobiales bacterium]
DGSCRTWINLVSGLPMKILATAALSLLCMATGTAAQVRIETQAQQAVRVDAIMVALDSARSPGAQVAVLHEGRVVLERGYGLAQLEYDVPVSPATVFHVASVSKQFTAFAITLLAQQGRLALDDDVRKHLEELSRFPHHVTLRQLIHHTSGVRDQWELAQMAGWRMDDVITRDQIMRLMQRQRDVNFAPGSEHLYSNMGYSLLAEVVERVSGRPFGEFLEANVFQPLGMTSTHVHNDHQRIVRNRAYSYAAAGSSGWRNAVLSYANQGATSLFTTAGDLARWLNNFETAQVGGAAAIAQMRQRGILTNGDTLPYAFAIVRGAHRGRETWGHSGSDAGFRSYVVHFPQARLGVVVLSNAASANPSRLALQIADVYLGETAQVAAPNAQPRPQPTSATQPDPAAGWQPTPHELRAFAGDYYSPELGVVYTFEQRDSTLWLVHRQGATRAQPLERDVFRAGRTARFERSEQGVITGFRLTGGRVRDLRFFRLATALPAIR